MEMALQYFPAFLLVLCRILGFFITAPVFSSANNVPVQFRIGIACFVSLFAFAAIGTESIVQMDSQYVFYVVRETLIGILLGFVAYLFFTVVQMAGSFIDLQIGLGIANVIDPITGVQSPIFGSFKYIVAMLLFLSWDGHHYLLLGIMDSYQSIPLDNSFFQAIAGGTVSELLVRFFASAFTLSFQMAVPIVAAMFLTDVALGILTKTAPQFNVFVVGIPLKLLAGFALMLLLVFSFSFIFQNLFTVMFDSLFEMMRAIRSAAMSS